MRSLCTALLLLSSFSLFSQTLSLRTDIPVIEGGDTLTSPFAGGLNQPQFSAIDLNADGVDDLLLFDRSGEIILPYLNEGGPGQTDYRYAPQYESDFPRVSHWMLLHDYNCDGKADIFTSGTGFSTVGVYRNDSDANGLRFTQVKGVLTYGALNEPLVVITRDLPGIADVDEDGDLDLLTFDFGGLYVEWYKNLSVEQNYGCDSLIFERASNCWGEFMENGLDNTVTLNVSCKGNVESEGGTEQHAGSTVAIFDQDGNGAKELLLGDIGAGNLVYLNNGGTPASAQMDAVNYNYPPAAPVNIEIFPAAFWLDVDLDGQKDLISAPNAPNVSINLENVWYYRDVDPTDTVNFAFESSSFLSDQMIECGSGSQPVFFDYNGDGLQDLLIGNFNYKSRPTNERGALTLYRNIGTPAQPAYELISRDYLGISSLFNPIEVGLVPALADMDNDGDEDLILGTSTGRMHYFRNDPSATDSAQFSLQMADMFGLDVGQGAAPEVIDLDGDGRLDLVVGENGGNFNYFRNTGSASQMMFAMPPDNDFLGEINVGGGFTGYSVGRFTTNRQGKLQFWVGGSFGILSRYDQIENNLGQAFRRQDSAFGQVDVGSRSSHDLADIDGDGQYELVVGNTRGGIAIFDTDVMTTALEPLSDPEARLSAQYLREQQRLRISLKAPDSRQPGLSLWDMQGRRLWHEQDVRQKGPLAFPFPLAPDFTSFAW
jgi:hypothetical protein